VATVRDSSESSARVATNGAAPLGVAAERRAGSEHEPDRPAAPAGLVRLLRAAGRGLVRLPRWCGGAAAAGWMGFNYWLSSGTRAPQGSSPVFGFVSNLAHAPLFGLLALWWLVALPRRAEPFPWVVVTRGRAWLVFALVVGWGALDEWHQSSVAGRDASLADLVTDAVGAASVLAVVVHAGRPDATARGVALRLVAGLCACAAAALVATFT